MASRNTPISLGLDAERIAVHPFRELRDGALGAPGLDNLDAASDGGQVSGVDVPPAGSPSGPTASPGPLLRPLELPANELDAAVRAMGPAIAVPPSPGVGPRLAQSSRTASRARSSAGRLAVFALSLAGLVVAGSRVWDAIKNRDQTVPAVELPAGRLGPEGAKRLVLDQRGYEAVAACGNDVVRDIAARRPLSSPPDQLPPFEAAAQQVRVFSEQTGWCAAAPSDSCVPALDVENFEVDNFGRLKEATVVALRAQSGASRNDPLRRIGPTDILASQPDKGQPPRCELGVWARLGPGR